MNFIMRDYHTDRDRGVYITSNRWNRSIFTTDAFRIDNVVASESMNNQLLRDIWENWMWNWYSDEDKEINAKEIKAADNDKVDEFLA